MQPEMGAYYQYGPWGNRGGQPDKPSRKKYMEDALAAERKVPSSKDGRKEIGSRKVGFPWRRTDPSYLPTFLLEITKGAGSREPSSSVKGCVEYHEPVYSRHLWTPNFRIYGEQRRPNARPCTVYILVAEPGHHDRLIIGYHLRNDTPIML